MDPITSVAVDLKVQQALTAYRTREDEDDLLADKASNSRVASLEARVDTTDAVVATKAAAADVYTRELTDQRISTAVTAANSAADGAAQALARLGRKARDPELPPPIVTCLDMRGTLEDC